MLDFKLDEMMFGEQLVEQYSIYVQNCI